LKINKSEIARNFWRDIIDGNKIDLSSNDARKKIVSQFLNDIENKKLGWKPNDRRFFRLGFDKICKERGISTHQFGIKPEPKRVKTQAGKMNISVNTDEKKVHPILREEENEKEDQENKDPDKTQIPNSQELQQQNQAAIYTGQSVAAIFSMMFNLLHSRFPACSPLTNQETTSLGEAWFPIFNEYLSDKGGKWVLPVVITVPIVLVRIAEFQRAKKEKEIEEEILKDMPQDTPIKKDPSEKKDKWSDRL
tara:strand:- start:90 stop:839 length:750 start_codon:yes stop_codon:yes gene_type:complete